MTGNDELPDDPLMDRLRREARAERPPFSAELHARIVREVKNGDAASLKLAASPFFGGWLVFRVAAVVILGVGLTAIWEMHLRRGAAGNSVVIDRTPKVERGGRPVAIFSPIDIGGVVSARLFPPEVRIQLPVIGGAALPESEDSQAEPSSVFEPLDTPADSAARAIADMVPPSLRAMVRLAQSATFADRQVSK